MSSSVRFGIGCRGASAFLLAAAVGAGPVFAQTAEREARTAGQEAREEARQTGNAVTDSWITMKVHSQFIPEDALEGSDIDVDTRSGVVTLNGTVASDAGRARAVAIAKATDGVKSVTDRLRIARADAEMAEAREAGREAGAETKEAGRDTADAAREAGRETAATAREAGREARGSAREATGTTGRALTDGWITSKIYSQYIVEDALDGSDIDVDITRGAVTLNGTVQSDAARSRALSIAKGTDGVKSVKDNLKVGSRSK
jgi:hyperosmotically inducible periplasmic protein